MSESVRQGRDVPISDYEINMGMVGVGLMAVVVISAFVSMLFF